MASYGNIARVGRRLRNPQHRFNLQTMPFQIQPFMIAPVIPGETMKNALLQSRVVTDPIRNKLIGWWCEYYFFYVKHRDLAGREDFTAMMLDLNHDMSAYRTAANPALNHFADGINWTQLCLDRVVETHFREEGDTVAHLINGMPAGAVNVESWLDSTALSDAYTFEDPVIYEDDQTTPGEVTASEVDAALQTWQFQRANNMTEMSYEDWLATYGIRAPRVELHRPEVLRYIREWQYPSNTIDPTTGAASSAVSWAIADRLDKDRFFAEPGFIFGVTVCRPKVYLRNVEGSATGLMDNALSWLPALMRDDPWTSMKKVEHDKGPLATVVTDTDGYWIDIKDLLIYGEDFINVARSATDLNMVTLPNADLSNKDYPTDADVDALFTGETDAGRQVRQDGVCKLSILGTQVDTTPPRSMGS